MSGLNRGFAWQARGCLVLGILAAVADQGSAQGRVEFTPYFVAHFPLKAYNRLQGASFKQTSAPGVGGKLAWWYDRMIGLEGDFNYVSSGTKVDFNGAPGAAQVFEDNGYQLNVTGRLVIKPKHTPLRVGLGLGYISRGGDAWRDALVAGAGSFKRHNLTTVASLGATPHLLKRIRLLIEVDALVYWVEKYRPSEGGFGHRNWMQADLQLKAGVPVGL